MVPETTKPERLRGPGHVGRNVNQRPKGAAEEDVNALINYLLENLILDFQGDLSMDKVRDFLRNEDSRDSRALLAKLVEEGGPDNMVITLADCLKEYIRTGINDEIVREQIQLYAES